MGPGRGPGCKGQYVQYALSNYKIGPVASRINRHSQYLWILLSFFFFSLSPQCENLSPVLAVDLAKCGVDFRMGGSECKESPDWPATAVRDKYVQRQ